MILLQKIVLLYRVDKSLFYQVAHTHETLDAWRSTPCAAHFSALAIFLCMPSSRAFLLELTSLHQMLGGGAEGGLDCPSRADKAEYGLSDYSKREVFLKLHDNVI
jgi:hypothetical protein